MREVERSEIDACGSPLYDVAVSVQCMPTEVASHRQILGVSQAGDRFPVPIVTESELTAPSVRISEVEAG